MEVGHGGVQKAPASGEGGPGDVWGDEAVLRVGKWVVGGRWFAGKDIEAGAGEVTCIEGVREGLSVH